MATIQQSDVSSLYRWGCWLLIAGSTAVMVLRIMNVRASTGETPMLSANDRSRWCTVRALVENGTYAIDPIIRQRHPTTHRRFWSSIDRVRHRGPDGREHDYSSKPTLFPTLLAGEYWVIRQVTGKTLSDNPAFVMRLMLILTNVLPLIAYFGVLMRLIQRIGQSDAARIYVMLAATFGTFLTAFAVTLNNHVPAAISVLFATAMILDIWQNDRRGGWVYAGAGLFSAFAAANELPALSFFAVVAIAAVWRSRKWTFLAFVPAAGLVAIGFFGTNYLAHGTVTPAYAHRSDGPVVARLPSSLASRLDQAQLPNAVAKNLEQVGISLSDQALVLVDRPGRRWEIWDRVGAKRFAIVPGEGDIEIRQWNNWYDYQGSYWRDKQQGVDRGEPSRLVYAMHMLVGHHGIFSLSPIWLISLMGVVLLIRQRRSGWWELAAAVSVLVLVCLTFYVARPEGDRNYGGVSCGFRWMFWFIPLWLICAVPAADVLVRKRLGYLLIGVFLLVSLFSANYCLTNPWTHPWLFDLGTYMGWWAY